MFKKATLIIPDEVNVKIDGLAPEVRRALHRKFSYEIPGARFMPAVKLGRWDGRVSFFAMSGQTYINLLPEVIPVLNEYDYDIEVEDIRDYCVSFEFDAATHDMFADKTWPEKHPMAGQPVMLRQDQVDAINSCLSNPQSLSCLATGFGKCLTEETEMLLTIDTSTEFGEFLKQKLVTDEIKTSTPTD